MVPEMAELKTEPGAFPYRRFAAFRRNSLPRFLADDRRILHLSNLSGQPNLWVRPIDPVLSSQQLTAFEEEALVGYDFSTNLSQLIVVTTSVGSGQKRIYSMNGLESWPLPLTPEDDVKISCGSEILAPNAEKIVYSSNQRDENQMDLVLLSIDSLKKEYLTDDGSYIMGYFRPDGNLFTAKKIIGPDHSQIHLVDTNTKRKDIILPVEEDCRVTPGPWSPDGSGFYVLSEEGLESMGLGFFDYEMETFEWVQRLNWDIENISLSSNGMYLAWVSNEDGYSRLCVKDFERDRIYSPPLPDGVMGKPSFSRDGASLVFELSTSRNPSSLYISDWGQNRVAKSISMGFLGRLEEEQLVEPNLIFYESEDGLKIPAFLYRPMMVNSTLGKAPVVVSIHSKPTGQARPDYNGSFQYLLNRGIGVLAPNIRGSGGYGRTYESLLFGDWGGEMLEDIKKGVEYLRQLEWVDDNRIGIIGRHFGGYAVLMSAAHLSDHFAGGVSLQGPCDLPQYVESLPTDERALALKLIGDPESERDFLIERSPNTHAASIDCRLMIVQGSDDRFVSEERMSQFVEDARDSDSEIEYLVLSDVGHEFVKRKNELKAWTRALDFLVRILHM